MANDDWYLRELTADVPADELDAAIHDEDWGADEAASDSSESAGEEDVSDDDPDYSEDNASSSDGSGSEESWSGSSMQSTGVSDGSDSASDTAPHERPVQERGDTPTPAAPTTPRKGQ